MDMKWKLLFQIIGWKFLCPIGIHSWTYYSKESGGIEHEIDEECNCNIKECTYCDTPSRAIQ